MSTQGNANAYDRALAQFEALALAPTKQIVRNRAGLTKCAGLPSSTGYRLSTIAEAHSVLQREPTGTYRAGPLLLRAGLSALGFGAFAHAASPVLVDLRHRAKLTAFLYVLRAQTLFVGPYSIGRSLDYVRPGRDYLLPSVNKAKTAWDDIGEIDGIDSAKDRSQKMLVRHGAAHADRFCGLGLMLPQRMGPTAGAAYEILSLAVERFAAAAAQHERDGP